MKIGFIGAGKVGFSLGKLFVLHDIPVTGYYSRRGESAEEAAKFTKTKSYSSMKELIQESDAIFLTVPDGAISAVYEEVAQYEIAEKQICHCSGAMTAVEAFPNIKEKKAYGYSIHPLFPVSDKYLSYRELAGAFFCLEGDSLHIDEWKERIAKIGPKVQIISADTKVQYHAACVFSSNLVCALAKESLQLLMQCGFEENAALQALAPLMRSNLEHILEGGPAQALTGPLERGDVTTIQKHLNSFYNPLDEQIYRCLSQKLLTVAEEKNPNRDYNKIKNLLEGEQDGKEHSRNITSNETKG